MMGSNMLGVSSPTILSWLRCRTLDSMTYSNPGLKALKKSSVGKGQR